MRQAVHTLPTPTAIDTDDEHTGRLDSGQEATVARTQDVLGVQWRTRSQTVPDHATQNRGPRVRRIHDHPLGASATSCGAGSAETSKAPGPGAGEQRRARRCAAP